MSEPVPKRVFISYARKDAAGLAIALQQNLEREFDVWLDSRLLEGGASWTREIEEAMDTGTAPRGCGKPIRASP